ncbi:MAG: phenylalanine--tRNA ligase subunit alpha, partial [Candidatus Schekmanbacteria bacterium RBG_13_48_7]
MGSVPVYPGKIHPFVKIQEETRSVFLSMGFKEVTTSYVESSFWNFDALFTPQDHPAREMQDTFYLKTPSKTRIPAPELVEQIRKTHENGGDTGSIGWGNKWDDKKSQMPTLRTHTTAASIRALAAHPEGPGKYFCIGPVFRRETTDYKHLPAFMQIDGIIVEENASFADLLGTLAEFYSKMGFAKFQFRPGFFPYTEPSVEVYVWNPGKKDWVEMGGAGIFRPEVTIPLGCSVPVLAWGLGLERIAMFRYS